MVNVSWNPLFKGNAMKSLLKPRYSRECGVFVFGAGNFMKSLSL
jgi:hypothetical protein